MDRSNEVEFTPEPTSMRGVEFTPDRGTEGERGERAGTAAGERTEEMPSRAREIAVEAKETASHQMAHRLDQGKDQVAKTLDEVAHSLMDSSRKLRESGHASGLVEGAADRVQRFSGFLRDTEVDEMVDRVQGFARRNPAVFLGGAFALGLVGARFIKSSGHRAERGRWEREEPREHRLGARDAVGRPGAPGYGVGERSRYGG
ncbi:MAG TPA: hypothetical protein VFQ38_15430 [Longimicrobiales bacterium]|nr:hypothetical protein [Longimicrobiales bacterium]